MEGLLYAMRGLINPSFFLCEKGDTMSRIRIKSASGPKRFWVEYYAIRDSNPNLSNVETMSIIAENSYKYRTQKAS